MAFELINVGTVVNDGTGDPLKTSFEKVNTVIAFLNGDFAQRFVTHNSNTTATANSLLFIDTSSNTVEVVLPAIAGLSIAVGTTVEIMDLAGTFNTNACTVSVSDGEKIQRVVASKILNTADSATRFIYTGITYGWLMS